MSPVLGKIQQPLNLIVYHRPGKELRVEVEKGEEEIDDDATLEGFETLQGLKFEEKPIITRSDVTRLIVYFPDGTKIREKFAAITLAKSIEKIGAERVKKLGITTSGVDLVSKNNNAKYNQHKIKGGYYICTHSSTKAKKVMLEEIARKLGIGLRVEVI